MVCVPLAHAIPNTKDTERDGCEIGYLSTPLLLLGMLVPIPRYNIIDVVTVTQIYSCCANIANSLPMHSN